MGVVPDPLNSKLIASILFQDSSASDGLADHSMMHTVSTFG